MKRRVILCGLLALLNAETSHASRGGYLIDRTNGQLGSLVMDGSVYASCSDGSGGFFIGGAFGNVGGLVRSNVAHIDADGNVTAWNSGTNFAVTGIALHGTTVYLGGTFSSVGGLPRTRLAAVDAETGSVLPWAPSADAQVMAIAQVGNTVFIGGAFSSVNGSPIASLAALDATTGALVPFAAYPNGQVYALTWSGSELLAGGEFSFIGGTFAAHVAALDPNTGYQTRFLPGTNGWVGCLQLSGTNLYVSGGFSTCFGQPRSGLAALDLATITLSPWDPGGGSNTCVDGGSLYVMGSGLIGGANRLGVARVDRVTARADSWAPLLTSPASLATIQAGTKWVFAGGSFGDPYQPPTDVQSPLVAKLPQFNGPVYVTLTCGDTCFVGGSFSRVSISGGGVPWISRSCLAAIRWSTGEVLDWNPNVSGTVNSILLRGNSVLIGGAFTYVNGETHKRIAILDRTTGTADPWDPGLDEAVASMVIAGNTLYVGGGFAHATGITRNAVCSFDLQTLTLMPWDPNVYPGPVYALMPANGQVYIGGDIRFVNGGPRTAIAEVDPITGVATTWAPDVGGKVYEFLLHGETLYVMGVFGSVEGHSRGCGAAWNVTSHQLFGWDPKANDGIYSYRQHEEGLLVGGHFTKLGDQTVIRVGWIDLNSGSLMTPVGVTPQGPVFDLGGKDQFLTIGGEFNIIDNGPDQGWFATTIAPGVVGVRPKSPGIAGLDVYPNPCSKTPELRWSASQAGPVQVELFDVSGRLVFAETWGEVAAGTHTFRPATVLSPGLYFFRLLNAEGHAMRRFVVLR